MADYSLPLVRHLDLSIEANANDMALLNTLNEEQQATYDEIMSVVNIKHWGSFFVDGPRDTEKTYLYRVLLVTICSKNKIVLTSSTSSFVASIMPGGRTAHSRSKVPLAIDDDTFFSFTKQEWYCQTTLIHL